MALPTCECVKGLPIGEQLAAIYCATYTLAAGDVDGPYLLKAANLSDVDDAAASRTNLGAAASASGYATFAGPTAARTYTLPDETGNVATTILKIKAGDTSRSSTDTPTDDPDLSQSLTPGTYTVEVSVNFGCASNTPGVRAQMMATGGTAVLAGSISIFNTSAGQRTTGLAPNNIDSTLSGFLVASNSLSAAARYGFVAHFSAVVTVTSTISFQWAQMTSDADATTAKVGSFMRIVKHS